MNVIKSISSVQKQIQQYKIQRKSIGFVPTMGALHKGHLSLIKHSRRENDVTILSIFVNPTQFGPEEDYNQYPRQEKNDILLAKNNKVDTIFYPSKKSMYPTDYLTSVNVKHLSSVLCGKKRKNHFSGVTTVVAKLLNIIQPDTLYLGQKDAQQAIIIKKMITDLNYSTKLKICPIIREKDGLALSSRNTYLTPKQRQEASILYKSLQEAKRLIKSGQHNAARITQAIKHSIESSSHGKIEYIECVSYSNLNSLTVLKNKVLIALAVKFGQTRLIDNLIVNI